MSEMVERVARAICETERLHPDDAAVGWIYWKDAARAAIEAMREPTDAMKVAALSATFDEKTGDRVHVRDVPIVWQAMIDAALGKKS